MNCPCHGVAWYVRPDGRRECRLKKRARNLRYSKTAKGRVQNRRAATKWRENNIRIKIGNDHIGSYPCTPVQRERIRAFRKEQRGETVA